MRLVIWTNNGQNLQLANVLDADLNITEFINFRKHLKSTRKRESKSISVKVVIVHSKTNARTVIMIITKRYMHLWHVCLIMTKFVVEISVTVRN